MNTKFLSIEPSNRSNKISIPFILASMAWFLVVIGFFAKLFTIVVLLVAGWFILWLFLSNDTIKSFRFIRYQFLTYDVQIASVEDSYYLGEEYFEVDSIRELIQDPSSLEEDELSEIIIN